MADTGAIQIAIIIIIIIIIFMKDVVSFMMRKDGSLPVTFVNTGQSAYCHIQ